MKRRTTLCGLLLFTFCISVAETVFQVRRSRSAGGDFQPTVVNDIPPPSPHPEGMVWIPGGEFSMGSEDPRMQPSGGHEAMADSRPIHRVYVGGFWMDRTDVTNAQFARFVAATGYITVAERKPSAAEFPDAQPGDLIPGSIVFTAPKRTVPLDDAYQWWRYVPGANWRHPAGPGSSIKNRDNYPVVQVAYEDAMAYAKWVHGRLPTEAEWEFAARGGLAGKTYVWGDDLRPGNQWMANTYQGHFPDQDTASDGFAGISPVAKYPANAYRLFDMAGDVWQWVSDWYREDYYATIGRTVARDPHGPASSFDPAEPGAMKRVQRGGSFLCTEIYCTRYMVGTRGKGEIKSASNHIGFRCVRDAKPRGGL
jgi:sulfatase modifying factor 1